MRLPRRYDFSARAYLAALGVVVAPDVELDRLSIGGRGATGNTPSHIEIVLDAAEAERRVAVDTWGEVLLPEWVAAQNLVSGSIAGRELRFPLEIRVERTKRSFPVDGRRRSFAGLQSGELVHVRATIDGAYVSVEGRAALLEHLRLRRLAERELRGLLP